MAHKPQIDLSLNQVGIIILCDSGVIYHNQTCGVACMQRYQEGVLLLPTDPELVYGAPIETYQCPIELGLRAMAWGAISGIDVNRADAIDSLLKGYPFTKTISVDRSRLDESEEAWVYVTLEPTGAFYSGFGYCYGILVWSNSD
jgi:hypothetical protein